MKLTKPIAAAFVALAVAACGGGTDGGDEASGAAGSAQPRAAGAPSAPDAPAAAAAADTADRDCPARPTTGAPAGGPVDDVVGIRPGMGWDDVQWVLACRDDVPTVEAGDTWNVKQAHGIPIRQLIRASDGQPCSGQEIVRDMSSTTRSCDDGGYKFQALKNIANEIVVVFTGLPEQETARAIWRQTSFPEGGQPAIKTLRTSLTDKYDEPQLDERDRQGRITLTWVHDLLGRPMSTAASAFNTCSRGLGAAFASSHSWSAGCGLTIRALISPVWGNDLLARELSLGLMHQKDFYDAGQRFERDLLAAHEASKREQAEAAAASGSAVDL
ncbi:MAG: hypothetical protein CMD39_08990 [Gammaproteobacteria bacterium]|nr:hypothetical protein [Gammaproteobacteria bacterium]